MRDIHGALRRRKKKKQESVAAYIQEMEYSASRAGLLAGKVHDCIVSGITQDVHMRFMLSVPMPRRDFLKMLDKLDHEIGKSREYP